jgi:NAD(P)H-dependent FMN reductase
VATGRIHVNLESICERIDEELSRMNILAISGSLRAASINSAFCRAAAFLAPPPMQITVFANLNALPLFNPDLEAAPPLAVEQFRAAVGHADALIIASPEYAHGISGVMKNALDWLVSFEGVIHKPIVLINTSPRAHRAYDSLHEILQTMSTRIIADASVTLPLLGSCTTDTAMINSPEVSSAIRVALAALADFLAVISTSSPSFSLE